MTGLDRVTDALVALACAVAAVPVLVLVLALLGVVQ